MTRAKVLVVALACAFASYGRAQSSGAVSGTVTESDGRPLSGVVVAVQGLGISVATSATGRYALPRADPTIETDFPDVEWSLLAKMRDKVTHQYWSIDEEVVWATAEEDIARIRELLRGALAAEA